MTAGEDAGATCVGYPPSLRSFGVMQLHGKSCKIFGFKELIGKIFKAKELASGRLLPGRYAQRASYIRILGNEKRTAVTWWRDA